MVFVLTADQEVQVAVSFMDAEGNIAGVSTPIWSESSAGAILTVVPAADGMSAMVITTGPIGTAQVSISAIPTDLSAGGPNPLVGVLDIQVVAGEAVVASFLPGVPSDKVAPAPVPTP